MKNIGNSIANICDSILATVITEISPFYVKLDLKLRGISFGKSIRFFGVAKFKRSNEGRICVGNNCALRSKSTSNLIGINRPCIITSLAPGSNLIIGDNSGFSGTSIGCFKKNRNRQKRTIWCQHANI